MAKIVFVQNIWFEFLGPMHISALLKDNGHLCDIMIVEDEEAAIMDLMSASPDIVAFSVMTGMHEWAAGFAARLKRHLSCITVFGGPHPTFFPEYIAADGVDAICRGEGEFPMLELADAVTKKEGYFSVKNFWFRCGGEIIKNDVRNLIDDLDILPFADRLLYRKYPSLDSNVAVFLASRGCPFDCSFCFNHQMMDLYRGKGKYVRHRSPESLIDEIRTVTKSGKVTRVYFQDDTFVLDRKWLVRFLDLYADLVAIPFQCLARINQIDDEIASHLSRSGCTTVFWGLESGDENIRLNILGKGVTDEQIVSGAAVLKRHGIRFRTYNIVGFPGESFVQALSTLMLNIRIRTDYPWCSIFMPYPGTRLAEYAKENGFLDRELDLTAMPATFFTGSMLRNEDQKRIVNLHKFFQTAVLFPFLLPLIKLLTKLPPNRLFQLWFSFIYFIVYVRSEGRGLSHALRHALKNVRLFRLRSSN